MKNYWSDKEAKPLMYHPLALRAYTSRLLGKDSNLVLHGGGNTSVKDTYKDDFGALHEVLYIKGSGWDLATIKEAGFAPVKLQALKQMAEFDHLSDAKMVFLMRQACLDPQAPVASVEAILHAIIPFKYVDHTHADDIVAITNTPNGKKYIQQIYGDEVFIVDYVMPGFVLAKKVFELTKNCDWSRLKGIVLLNHGLFTFADTAKESYDQHLRLVKKASDFMSKRRLSLATAKPGVQDLLTLAKLRLAVSQARQAAQFVGWQDDPRSVGFSRLKNASTLVQTGTLTPDHVIRIKPFGLSVSADPSVDVKKYIGQYQSYYQKYASKDLRPLDPAPRWAVWPSQGILCFGSNAQELTISADILAQTIKAMQYSQQLGGYKPVLLKDLFDVEYWELEQAKLAKMAKPLAFAGRIVVVTGAASGIGLACVKAFLQEGAAVIGVDINLKIINSVEHSLYLGIKADLTKLTDIKRVIATTIKKFGGLDILVSNAGIFTPSERIEQLSQEHWQKSLDINLTAHQQLIAQAVPYLTYGIEPSIIMMGSKNVPAPGPGAGAYSVAKAGLTQLARVAALELAPKGIRVNTLHPNQVFDTAIWTDDVIKARAKNYGLSVEAYKRHNLLQTTITSHDVARLVVSMASSAFAKTTGVQVPIDGGNERVI